MKSPNKVDLTANQSFDGSKDKKNNNHGSHMSFHDLSCLLILLKYFIQFFHTFIALGSAVGTSSPLSIQFSFTLIFLLQK